MLLSAFDDASHQPGTDEVLGVLGSAAEPWAALVAHVTERHAPVVELWNHGAKSGWTLRLKRKERIVAYLTPQRGAFVVGLVLGEKAVGIARDSGLPDAVMEAVDAAPRYAEGRGLRLQVANAEDLRAVEQLIDAKMAT
jgi:hypothetical protein